MPRPDHEGDESLQVILEEHRQTLRVSIERNQFKHVRDVFTVPLCYIFQSGWRSDEKYLVVDGVHKCLRPSKKVVLVDVPTQLAALSQTDSYKNEYFWNVECLYMIHAIFKI